MHVYFVLLASGTASNKGTDKGGKARPPEIGSDQLLGFKEARMSRSCMIVTALENIAAKIISRWDIDTALKSEDAVNVLPIGQLGAECRRNGAIHRLQGLEDKGVGRRGGGNAG